MKDLNANMELGSVLICTRENVDETDGNFGCIDATQVNFAYLTDVTDEICERNSFSELPELQMQEMGRQSSQRDSMRFIAWMLRFR